MNISYILCLFLAVFSSACDDDKTDENNAKQVTVTISPSDKVIVEGEGGDISFTVTPSDPAVELRYVSETLFIPLDTSHAKIVTIAAIKPSCQFR